MGEWLGHLGYREMLSFQMFYKTTTWEDVVGKKIHRKG